MQPPLGRRRLHCLLTALLMLAPVCQGAFSDSRESESSETRPEEKQNERPNGDDRAVTPQKVSNKECPGTTINARSDQLRLIFKKETLENIVTAFNRCNVMPKIRVVDTSLQARRYTLSVYADDPNSFLDYLAIDENIVIEIEDTQRFVVRLRTRHRGVPKQSTASQRRSMQSDLKE